jgi:hypothetical protein
MQIADTPINGRRGTATALLSIVILMLALGSARDAHAAPFTCTPIGVAAFSNRVHVRCSPATADSIGYFAVCTSPDSGFASRALSVFTTAKVTGKNLVIYYNTADTSGTACGCAASDCRVITGAEVQQ